jgi:hypothetical protein
MTFEEFFLKKKIDLNKLKQANDGLYTQFKSHFTLMGEKSFDHTKKYWFNRLRKDFRLSEEEEERLKALNQKIVAPTAVEAKAAETEAVAAKPTGFKPKFKAASLAPKETQTPEEEKTASEPVSGTATVAKPAGFKPRFKAGATPIKNEEVKSEEPQAIPETQESKSSAPVGFKPRFKAGATTVKAEDSKIQEPQATPNTDEPKPSAPVGFKPRFKVGATTVKTEEPKVEEPAQTDAENNSTDHKPLGFKPKFKAKTSTTVDEKQVENSTEETTKTPEEAKADNPTTPKPLGFKPRFKPNK